MPVMRVNKKNQVTIPASIRKELNISAGDPLEARVTKTKDGVVYKIKRMSGSPNNAARQCVVSRRYIISS